MDEDQHDERFPLVFYRHDGGELMVPASHVTTLLRHIAETFRLWRVRGQVRMDLETTARLYDALGATPPTSTQASPTRTVRARIWRRSGHRRTNSPGTWPR
ncbi:hypothetical protein ACIGXI_34400 [Kitasatospora aureofaciens]|uniref:hypothetical protein n=1 Tax=Kitasatospora aureofaciens TaxID=1894 RepID=UPI0037CB7C3D